MRVLEKPATDKREILNRLDKVAFFREHVPSLKINGKPDALGLCPFHDDRNPSLSVNVESGLYQCFSCGASGDLFTFYQKYKGVDFLTALQELGDMVGIVGSSKPQVVAVFEYMDEAGNLLYAKERLEPGRNGRAKEFFFKHLTGGKQASGRGCDSVLYRLPELAKSKYAFVVEGEGKADLLNSWGLTATCLDSGANSPWKDEYLKAFEGKEKVVLLPDNDLSGRDYASKIANALHGSVGELKVVELLGLQEKGDVLDWVAIPGNCKEELLGIVKDTPVWMPGECGKTSGFDLEKALISGAELQTLDIPVSWAVNGLIPRQAITLLAARGGMGKTILTISLANSVSKGIPFLGLETTKMPVVYADFENSLPTLIERVKRVDAGSVFFWHPVREIKPPRLDSKEYELFKKLPEGSLLIFDTLRASQSRDENDSQHMAMIMQRLKELRDCGYTVLILHHTSKSSDRVYKGSTVIFDLCDHSLSLHKVKKGCPTPDEDENDSEEENYYRLGTQDKTRYEPFHVFVQFDAEAGRFVIAPDPEMEILEEIHSLLAGSELKQSDAFELVKKELGIRNKPKVLRLLKKGVANGCFEERKHPGMKAIFYAANLKFNSSALYTGTIELLPKTVETIVHNSGTIANQNDPESLASAVLSNSSPTHRTIGTIAENRGDNSSDNADNSSGVVNYCEDIFDVEFVEEISNV